MAYPTAGQHASPAGLALLANSVTPELKLTMLMLTLPCFRQQRGFVWLTQLAHAIKYYNITILMITNSSNISLLPPGIRVLRVNMSPKCTLVS